jgi:hypothetical protein
MFNEGFGKNSMMPSLLRCLINTNSDSFFDPVSGYRQINFCRIQKIRLVGLGQAGIGEMVHLLQ